MPGDRLLREYVQAVLAEDDTGGVYGDLATADAMQNPYGVSYGSGKDLYNIFVKPFTDVVGVAAGKTKELSEKGQTLLHVAFETVATSLIPILCDSYSEIFAKEQEQVDKIRREYSDVFQSTWDAFKDHDVLLAGFLYSPAAFVTAALAKKSPKVVSKMISVLSGGNLDPWLQKVSHAFGWDSGEKSTANKDVKGGSVGYYESLLREEGKQLPPIEQVLASDKVRAAIADSEVTKKLERVGQQIVRGTLKQVYKQASGVLQANSLQDLQNKTGKKLKGLDKLAKVPQAERQAAEQELLKGAKKSMAEFYVKNLEAQAKKAIDQGVPEDSPYVQDIRRVASKIKAL